jgi:hypothetical protein
VIAGDVLRRRLRPWPAVAMAGLIPIIGFAVLGYLIVPAVRDSDQSVR